MVSPARYEATRIGPGPDNIPLSHHTITCTPAIRILGIRVPADGTLARWSPDPDLPLRRLHANLTTTAHLHNPRIFLRATHLSTISTILAGCELWSLQHVHATLHSRANPYKHPAYNGILHYLRSITGLLRHSFTAAIYLLYGLPTLLNHALP